MKVLLSNDDGIHASGLHALAAGLCEAHTVMVAAPDGERSAVSHCTTLFAPLRATPAKLDGLPDIPAYGVNGTPVDCVRLGIGRLFESPDIVISGINHGPNTGTDVLYSGTVGASQEAALLGYPAIAISICSSAPKHYYETAVYAVRWGIDYLREHPLPFGALLNINVPDIPLEQVKGVRTARTCMVTYQPQFDERVDPSGKAYYWALRKRIADGIGRDTDENLVHEGYIAVTPLSYDMTDHQLLATMTNGIAAALE